VRVTDSASQSITRTLAITVKPADKLAPFGVLETPDVRATLNNTASGSGWALDNVGVSKIEVLIDGQKATEAIYGLNRPDIGAVWGSAFPNAGSSGFSFVLDTTKFSVGEHILAIRLIDAAGNTTVVGTRTVMFQNLVFTITTIDLIRGTRNQPYSMQMGAANGRPPYTWSLLSGSLPAGLSMNVAGLISGTPTVFGVFPFVVRATDSIGAVAIASVTLTVLSDVEALRIISNGPLLQGTTGVDYTYQLLFVGGIPPRTWSVASGALPPGLSLSSSGIISGKPADVGTFNFTTRLTDSTQTSVTSQPLQITVVAGPLIIVTSGDLTRGTVSSQYLFTLEKLGGDPPYTWALASGALPPGLLMNPATGVIAGIPTQFGTFSFAVRLTDSQPESVTSGTLRIIVDPAPLLITSTGDLTGGRVNIDYSFQLVATGGRTPYTWALVAGAPLPPGLTLDPATGVISGRPTTAGVYAFTVKVTDATPATATSSLLRITISP
jgi:Putative Ig domain.